MAYSGRPRVNFVFDFTVGQVNCRIETVLSESVWMMLFFSGLDFVKLCYDKPEPE